MSVIEILSKYHEALLSGLRVTLELCTVIWVTGVVLGSFVGVAGARSPVWMGGASRVFSFFLSGVPVLVLLSWCHYPAQAMLQVVIDPFYTAAVTLSILNVVAVADTIRPVLMSFPQQYLAAARVCGFTRAETVRYIQLPLVLRQVIPTILMIQVNMLQATLFASLISVEELFRVAQRINAAEYRPIEIYSALALLFLLICLPINGVAHWLHHKYSRNLSER